jgi:hypothetical protein
VRILDELKQFWRRTNATAQGTGAESARAMRKQWRASWLGRVAWPWFRRELEIVLKVSGVIVLSVWAKRLVEQFLGATVLNERIIQGEVNALVEEIEQEITARRPHGHQRRK